MNENIKRIWDDAAKVPSDATWQSQVNFMNRFAELIVRECANCCGSQADIKNIKKHFGIE